MNEMIGLLLVLVLLVVQLNITSSQERNRNKSILSSFSNYPWSKYSRDILKRSTADTDYRYPQYNKGGRIYYAVFAGRSRFLKIQLQYCDILLKLKLVTEVHIWDFNRNENDNSDYINKYTRDTPSEGYRIFEIPTYSSEENPTELTTNYLYRSYYEHYAYNKRYRDTDILIKADDDIVYMDLSHFARFINDISSYADGTTTTHLHFPNIINNDAGFIVQSTRIHNGLFNKWTDYYSNDLRMNLTVRLASAGAFNSIEPATGWSYGLHTKSDFAYSIHQLFLSNPKEFISRMHSSAAPKREDVAVSSSYESIYVEAKSLIFSDMYAARMNSIRHHFDNFLHRFCCNFDTFIGMIPTESVSMEPNIIHVDFVVSHLAYDTQYDADTVSFDKLTVLYDEIAMKFTKSIV